MSAAGEAKLYATVADVLPSALTFFTSRDLDFWAGYTRAWQARCLFEQGRWSDATRWVDEVVAAPHLGAITVVTARCVQGRIRARRGDPGVWESLDEAKQSADEFDSLQRIAPVAAARAEARWLAGERDDGRDGLLARLRTRVPARESVDRRRTRALVDSARHPARTRQCRRALSTAPGRQCERRRPAVVGSRMPLRGGRCLVRLDVGAGSARQALQIAPTSAPDRCDTRHASAAEPRHPVDPPGPAQHGGDSPRGPTGRKQEVQGWLRHGATDAEIAARLHLSVKTVGHHVSAILRKTGTTSRRDLLDRQPPH